MEVIILIFTYTMWAHPHQIDIRNTLPASSSGRTNKRCGWRCIPVTTYLIHIIKEFPFLPTFSPTSFLFIMMLLILLFSFFHLLMILSNLKCIPISKKRILSTDTKTKKIRRLSCNSKKASQNQIIHSVSKIKPAAKLKMQNQSSQKS